VSERAKEQVRERDEARESVGERVNSRERECVRD